MEREAKREKNRLKSDCTMREGEGESRESEMTLREYVTTSMGVNDITSSPGEKSAEMKREKETRISGGRKSLNKTLVSELSANRSLIHQLCAD